MRRSFFYFHLLSSYCVLKLDNSTNSLRIVITVVANIFRECLEIFIGRQILNWSIAILIRIHLKFTVLTLYHQEFYAHVFWLSTLWINCLMKRKSLFHQLPLLFVHLRDIIIENSFAWNGARITSNRGSKTRCTRAIKVV